MQVEARNYILTNFEIILHSVFCFIKKHDIILLFGGIVIGDASKKLKSNICKWVYNNNTSKNYTINSIFQKEGK